MTPEDELHLKRILEAFKAHETDKYTKGNAEHGGHLNEKDCLTLLLQEVLDLVPYAYTAIEQRDKAIEALDIILDPKSDCYTLENILARLERIRNLLKYGNKSGIKYED